MAFHPITVCERGKLNCGNCVSPLFTFFPARCICDCNLLVSINHFPAFRCCEYQLHQTASAISVFHSISVHFLQSVCVGRDIERRWFYFMVRADDWCCTFMRSLNLMGFEIKRRKWLSTEPAVSPDNFLKNTGNTENICELKIKIKNKILEFHWSVEVDASKTKHDLKIVHYCPQQKALQTSQ